MAVSRHTCGCVILGCIAEGESGWAPWYLRSGAWGVAVARLAPAWHQRETIDGGLGLTKKRVIRSSMVGR